MPEDATLLVNHLAFLAAHRGEARRRAAVDRPSPVGVLVHESWSGDPS